MKKRLLTTFAATLSLFMSQCSELPTQKEAADGSKSIRIEIKTAPGFDTIAARAYVQISADDMKSTLYQKLTISNDWISGVVRNVPVGYDRHFEVFVEGFDSTLMYYGDTTAAIYSGKETYVTIILRKPGGTAIINGYIEDYESPSETIPTPMIPYIYSFDTTITIPPRLSQVTFATNGSKYPDSLFYMWRIVHIVKNDTFENHYRSGETFTLIFPEDGTYHFSVSAMSMTDTTKVSEYSPANCFSIINGLFSGSLTDTSMPVIYLNGPDTMFLPLDSSYTELGAKAYDIVDGDLTDSIKISGNVNTAKAGYYYITYTVSDNAYNICSRSRLVIVKGLPNEDTTPPVISLRGPLTVELAPGDVYLEPGYSAFDDVDSDITSRVKSVLTYDSLNSTLTKMTYTVFDNAGNCATAFRTIIRIKRALPTPAMPTIISSKTNGKKLSITFQTSVVDPTSLSGSPVYYDWTILTPDTPGVAYDTTTKNSLTCNFQDNTSISVVVKARYLEQNSLTSPKLAFSIVNGKIVYLEAIEILY